MAQAESDIQKALLIVDPGFSKSSLKVAQSIAEQLNRKGIAVALKI